MKASLFTLAATGALASYHAPLLIERQTSCESEGYKTCGDGCILPSWTCCPREDGGCPSGSECFVGSNDKTGCCLYGDCSDLPGGVNTDTVVGPGQTSTIRETSTSTQETTYSASLPITTLSTTFPSDDSTTVPPAPWPTPVPTGNGTATTGTAPGTATTGVPPVPTGGASVLASNLLAAVIAAGAAFIL